MAKKINYASMFTLRKDGRYCGTYVKDGKRHYVYDKDPERLWHKMTDPFNAAVYTFSDAADVWQREHYDRISYKTAEAYSAPLRRLKNQFGSHAADSITSADVSAYLQILAKQNFSRRSVQMHRDILNMIFTKAIVDGHMKNNPCDAVSLPRNLVSSIRTLPSDDAIRAVKAEKEHPFSLFALICLYSGLRRGEVLALRYEDIDRQQKVIHVNKAVEYLGNNPHIKPPKTKAGARDAILLDVLADLIPEGSGNIFCTGSGELLTKTMYRKRWESYCRKIGFEISAHQLRHGFATILYEAGVADKDAQELLGHSNITTTRNVYTHIRQTRREETAAKLNSFISGL